ncbi:hypothetical protein [Mycobacterium haemophilum]|uniref:hypothetical protein n=1 Tax=Mycobacterium haemophilum TaxID=29311 RepID=UPI0021F2D4E0|nr:hypothetical protein [Mycobacterium haemophilum]MCV7339915.1 hypothetical protein [Mycobacterium haemophilum DSM 44634]
MSSLPHAANTPAVTVVVNTIANALRTLSRLTDLAFSAHFRRTPAPLAEREVAWSPGKYAPRAPRNIGSGVNNTCECRVKLGFRSVIDPG